MGACGGGKVIKCIAIIKLTKKMEGDLSAVQKELNFVPLIADVLTKFNNQSPESAHKDRQDLVHLVNKFNKQHEQLLKSVNGLSGTDLSAHEQRELYEQCETELKRKQ